MKPQPFCRGEHRLCDEQCGPSEEDRAVQMDNQWLRKRASTIGRKKVRENPVSTMAAKMSAMPMK
jgi:hypothetical protein